MVLYKLILRPNTYPNYGDFKTAWDLSEENFGHEWIELEFAYEVYVSKFEIYETFKPGHPFHITI